MKTHELARSLEVLAKALRSAPDIDINKLKIEEPNEIMKPDEIKIGLSHLVALSRVDKQQWINLISEYKFPIELRPRDASRDILGKLLRFLESNPEARTRLERSTTNSNSKSSPELLKALGSILKE